LETPLARLVYRAGRAGILGIVGLFRGVLGIARLARPGKASPAPDPWPLDQPLVSVLLGKGATLSEQTLTDVQQLSGTLADGLTQAHGKYLALVPDQANGPSLLEQAVLVLEAGPKLGFVCGEAGVAVVRRSALADIAVPQDADGPALLQLLKGRGWGSMTMGQTATTGTGGLRFLPEPLLAGLREAWRDHLRACRGGVASGLVDYGRGLRTTTPDLPTVLWLIPQLHAGGAEAVLINLQQVLAKSYHFLLCVTSDSHHDWRDRCSQLGEVYVLPELLPRRCWPVFLERLIRAKRPRAIMNAHSQYGYDMAHGLRQRFPEVLHFDLLHNDSELGFIHHAAKHDDAYDGHVVVSERIRDTLVTQYGVDRGRVHAIVNGIDANGRFDPEQHSRDSASDEDGDYTVGYVGRLSTEKDPLLFVDTAGMLLALEPRCRFVIAGSGPLATKVRARIAARGLTDRCQMLGHVKVQEIPAVLASLDLCMVTSRVEGCPLVALEAMAMGLPVVSTDAGNLASMLAAPRGRAVASRDPHRLAVAVQAELASSRDPARREQIRRSILGSYDLDTMGRRYAALFAGEDRGLETERPSPNATATAR